MYWAYLHSNGQVIVKPWFGDHADYTTDCENNPFVKLVLRPFNAFDMADAWKIAFDVLKNARQNDPALTQFAGRAPVDRAWSVRSNRKLA